MFLIISLLSPNWANDTIVDILISVLFTLREQDEVHIYTMNNTVK